MASSEGDLLKGLQNGLQKQEAIRLALDKPHLAARITAFQPAGLTPQCVTKHNPAPLTPATTPECLIAWVLQWVFQG